MQKIIFAIFFLSACASSNKTPLHKQFPYGLLTDDFGILSKDDLMHYQLDGKPHPIGEKVEHFIYWVCAPTEKVKFQCQDFGPESPTEHYGETEIFIQDVDVSYEFGGRRAFPIEGCRAKVDIWKNLSKGQSHICVAGEQAGSGRKENGRFIYSFVHDRVQTKLGCESWFEDGCKNTLE